MTYKPRNLLVVLTGVCRALAITAVISGFAACAQTQPSNAAGYQIFEMRSDIVRPIRPTGDHNLAWLDEERVIFEGWDRTLMETRPSPKPQQFPLHGLYIWNIRTGAVTRYTTEPLRGGLCFADGYINYVVFREGREVRLEGPFGHEKPLAPLRNELRDRKVNRFTCRSYEQSDVPRPIMGGGIEPLRPEDGWLEHTGSATWLRSPTGRLTLLSEEGRGLGTVKPRKYSVASGSYVFWRPFQNKTWLITAQGSAELQTLPANSGLRGFVEPAFTGASLLISTQLNVRANRDAGRSGIYIYTDSQTPERLITGLIDAMQVHRSGCLVSVIVDPWDRKVREHELKVAKICRGNHVGK